MSAAVKHAVDWVAFLCAGVAVVSWANAAFAATIFAGVASGILATIRVYHLVRYGPKGARD